MQRTQVHRFSFWRSVRATLPILAAIIALGTTGCASQIERRSSDPLGLSATTLAFGNINVGNSRVLSVKLTNTGSSNITISRVSISGAGFTASGVSSGEVLDPGQTVALNVTFAPSASGSVSGAAITVDNDASNAPGTVVLTGTGVTNATPAVTLSWEASASTVAGYQIYRSSSSSGPFTTALNSSPVTTTQYVDSTVAAGQTYYYAVTAVNPSGGQSTESNVVSVTIP